MFKEKLTVAVVQVCSGEDVSANLRSCRALVRGAAARGAQMVVLPENYGFMGPDRAKAELPDRELDRIRAEAAEAAAEGGVYLVAGGHPERSPEPIRVYNTATLFGPDGAIISRYRKLHLFDVDLADGTRSLESDCVAPGDEAVVARTPLASVGLSICYDLRFPELYRRLAKQGAELVVVPAAFTMFTGKDHWQVLLRARAIENQVFVAAAAQWGNNFPGRTTYGRAQLIDPWGTVLACAGDGDGVAVAELDPAAIHRVRAQIPCGTHVREDLFSL